MSDGCLVDFCQGWLIEVLQVEVSQNGPGFEVVCYSPCRQKICDDRVHASAFKAMKAARQIIKWHGACQMLSKVLRQFYEADRLDFEEWRSLHQSLVKATEAYY